MTVLFDSTEIRGMALRNRFVRSATYDGCAEKNGHVSQKQLEMFGELARSLFQGMAEGHKTERDCPGMMVGGLRSVELMEQVIQN